MRAKFHGASFLVYVLEQRDSAEGWSDILGIERRHVSIHRDVLNIRARLEGINGNLVEFAYNNLAECKIYERKGTSTNLQKRCRIRGATGGSRCLSQ